MTSPRLLRLLALLGSMLTAFDASALIMRDDGPEPVHVVIKQSIRLADDFDAQLQTLATLEASLDLRVIRRFAGSLFAGSDLFYGERARGGKYIELVGFPSYFTEAQAYSAMAMLERSPVVEFVVPVSSYNALAPWEFGQEFGPNEVIPEATKRGLASEPTPPFDPSVVLQPHAPNQLIVDWKPEFIWHAERTGFVQRMAEFNASVGCSVLTELWKDEFHLTQVLTFSGPDALLADKLRRYLATGWVVSAQVSYLYSGSGVVGGGGHGVPTGPAVIGLPANAGTPSEPDANERALVAPTRPKRQLLESPQRAFQRQLGGGKRQED